MKFKRNISYLEFMKTVQTCNADVYFNSKDGDHLNLKSALSQALFSIICGDRAFLECGDIECIDGGDYRKLSAFLTGEPA